MAKFPVGLPENFSLKVSSEELLGAPAELPGYLDHDPVVEMAKYARQQQNRLGEQNKVIAPIVTPPIVATPVAVVQSPFRVDEKTINLEAQVKSQILSASAVGFVPTSSAIPVKLNISQSIPTIAKKEVPVTEPLENSPSQQSGAEKISSAGQDLPHPETKSLHVVETAPKLHKKVVEVRRLQINVTPDVERKVEELINLISAQIPQKEITISELMQALVLNIYESKSEINVSQIPLRGKWGTPTARAYPVALSESFREAIVEQDKKSGGNPFKKAVGG